MERYKGYKIPLVHLRVGNLAKQLRNAGSRIIATPEQAASLEGLKDLLVVSETEAPTVDESEVPASVETLKGYVARLSGDDGSAPSRNTDGKGTSSAVQDLVDSITEEEDADEDDECDTPRMKAAKKRKADDGKAALELMGKFVSVTDILPPLPKKGTFNVEMIKASPYFFS